MLRALQSSIIFYNGAFHCSSDGLSPQIPKANINLLLPNYLLIKMNTLLVFLVINVDIISVLFTLHFYKNKMRRNSHLLKVR